MLCLKSSISMLIVLFAIICNTESRAFYRRLYGRPAEREIIGNLKDRLRDTRESQSKHIIGDVICGFCKKTKNATCITRFCEGKAVKDVLVGPGGSSGLGDKQRPSINLLADALCQFCIATNNATCIARYCNNSPSINKERFKEPTLLVTDKLVTFGNLREAIHKRSVSGNAQDVQHEGGPGDIEEPNVSLIGDVLCQFCINTNNATCIARYCNSSPSKATELTQEPALLGANKLGTFGAPREAIFKRSVSNRDQELNDISSMIEDIVSTYDEQ